MFTSLAKALLLTIMTLSLSLAGVSLGASPVHAEDAPEKEEQMGEKKVKKAKESKKSKKKLRKTKKAKKAGESVKKPEAPVEPEGEDASPKKGE